MRYEHIKPRKTLLYKWGQLYLKCEYLQPSGSIKDRPVWEILQHLELEPGTNITEATSGNTGVSLAMYAAAMGLRATIVVPPSTSMTKLRMIAAYGANIALGSDIAECQIIASEIAKEQEGVYLNQFNRLENYFAQVKMARECYAEVKNVGAIVSGVGTGATLAALRTCYRNAKIYVPVGAGIEGTQDGVSTPLLPRNLRPLTEVPVEPWQRKESGRILASEHGMLTGHSANANIYVASLAALWHPNETILTILPDSGWRYL